ncbi:MAG: glycosyltransferase family 4 protein [Gammaproteobacteria bacterium]
MHVAYVDPRPVPGLRAEAMQLLQTVDGLAQAGAEVTLIAPGPRDGTSVEDILGRPLHRNVTWLSLFDPRKRWWFPLNTSRPFFRRATTLIRSLSPDAIMCRHLGVADHVLRHLPRARLFFELHEVFATSFEANHPQPDTAAQAKLDRLRNREQRVYRAAAGLITLTDELGQQAAERYSGIAPRTTVPNAVDNVLAEASRRDKATPDRMRILYLGGLHPWKGVNLAIEMMQWLPTAHLSIVGSGSAERMEELRTLSRDLGIGDRVDLVGPIMPPSERFSIIADHDLCVLPLLPNNVGTSPLKLFEYLTMGKPTVVADLPSLRRLVTDGEHVLLATAEDPRAFAHCLERLIDDPALYERLSHDGQALASTQGWAQRGTRLLNAFKAEGTPDSA